MLKKRWIAPLLLAMITSLMLSACQPTEVEVTKVVEVEKVVTATPPSDEPQTLVVGLNIADASSLDPHWHFQVPGAVTNYMTYEPLVKITAEDFSIAVPHLAEKWELADDGVTYTFYLRPGVKFSSGNPLTAEDVRFSWMRQKNKKGSPSWFMGWVKDMEVVDDLTLKVILNEPAPGFIMVATIPYLGVLDSKVLKEHGGTDADDAATTDTATAWLDQNSAGSGAYVLTKWSPNAEIVMEANPYYWGGKPAFG
jgi:peptide/nickel transport system substrate-binding protein